MKIVKAGYQILNPDLDDPNIAPKIYRLIELAGRTCYKSEDKITPESGEKFVRAMVRNGHEAMIEHAHMTVKFTVDRGVSHELVRHRLCSFAQESQRYCAYNKDKFGGEVAFIEPGFFNYLTPQTRKQIRDILDSGDLPDDFEASELMKRYALWYGDCQIAERGYLELLNLGCPPEEARAILPNSTKTEIVVTADMREWRHIFKLRAAGLTGKPHPQMLEVMVPLLNECRANLPALFEDILPMEE